MTENKMKKYNFFPLLFGFIFGKDFSPAGKSLISARLEE